MISKSVKPRAKSRTRAQSASVPFEADDEEMTIQKKSRARSDTEATPQNGVRRKRGRRTDREIIESDREKVARQAPKKTTTETQTPKPEPPKPPEPKTNILILTAPPTPKAPPAPPTPPPKAKATPKAKTRVKPTIQKERTLTPTQIGIQRIRELFEEAKNKGKITQAVYLDYDALYKSWLANKGNREAKASDLKPLKSLYGEHLYKE